MFWNKTKNRKPAAVRSSKLRLEILEDRRLLSAADWNAPGKTAEVCDVASATFNETIETPVVSTGTNELVVTTNVDELNGNGLDAATSDANGLSLREAIYYADAGTTITFKESLKGTTINLDGKELEITRSLTINASALYDATTNTPGITLDASGYSRVMGVSFADANPTKSSLELVGLTLRGGNAEDGGGLFISGGTVTATNVKISSNTATNTGGGVYVNKPGTFIATNVEISGNTAYDGGGVNSEGGTVTLSDVKIADNSTSNNAGALRLYEGSIAIVNSEISGNTAKVGGGAWLTKGVVTATNTKIVGNTAQSDFIFDDKGDGGGVAVLDDGIFNAINTEISGNKATYGGGVYVKFGAFNATNVTIAGNQASNLGGGIYVNDKATATLNNSIVVKNTGAEVCNGGTIKAFNVLSSFVDWDNKSDRKYYEYQDGAFPVVCRFGSHRYGTDAPGSGVGARFADQSLRRRNRQLFRKTERQDRRQYERTPRDAVHYQRNRKRRLDYRQLDAQRQSELFYSFL